MSGTVTIGDSQRAIDDADAQWITEQLNRRRQAGEAVCVRVAINTGNIDFTLASGDCPTGGGMGRRLTPEEEDVLASWRRFGLDDSDFPPGKLVAFLQQF